MDVRRGFHPFSFARLFYLCAHPFFILGGGNAYTLKLYMSLHSSSIAVEMAVSAVRHAQVKRRQAQCTAKARKSQRNSVKGKTGGQVSADVTMRKVRASNTADGRGHRRLGWGV